MKGFIALPIIIVIIILFTGSTAGTYVVLKNNSSNKTSPSSSSTTTTSESSSSANVNPSPTPSPTPSPSTNKANYQTTTPSSNPTPNTQISPKPPVDLNENSPIRLESVSPSSGIQNQAITLRGKNFGPSTGKVLFYNSNGTSMGGPSIDNWTETEIRTTAGFMLKGPRTFYLEIETSAGAKSNKIPFYLSAGQPYVDYMSPVTLTRGTQHTFTGSEFGASPGSIRFFNEGGYPNPTATAQIHSWSDTNIAFTVPTSLDTKDYSIDVLASDGRTSSVHYYTIK